MAARALLLVAALALAFQAAAADSVAVWSNKPLSRVAVLQDELDLVLATVADAKPEFTVVVLADPTIDAPLRRALKIELGDREADAYLPYVPPNTSVERALTIKLSATYIEIRGRADLHLIAAADSSTVVAFKADPALLSEVFAKVDAVTSSVSVVYSLHNLGYVDIIHDRERRSVMALETDPTEDGAEHFARTLEGLFETYTIFSPATFMGIMVVLVLLITVFIGFGCLMGLQTPSHFEKKAE